MTQNKAHTRVIQTILGPAEKRLLIWIAERLPAWVTPDILTGLGIFASILIFVSFVLTNLSPAFLWLASFGVFLNWFGDSLDGTLARVRKIERPQYGFFVDHAVDAISETLVFLGIGLSPYVDFRIASLCLIAYLLLSIYTYLYTYVKGVFRISFAKLGPTEVRIIAILSNTFVFFIGNPKVQFSFGAVTFYSLVVALLGLALLMAYLVVSIGTAMDLSAEDRAAAKASRSERRASHKKSHRRRSDRGSSLQNEASPD
jgi:phosphatidylglycerophosphate synthase